MLGTPELVAILMVVLLLFGGSQLPKLAKNLGRAQREFKDGLADGAKSDKSDGASDAKSASETGDSKSSSDASS